MDRRGFLAAAAAFAVPMSAAGEALAAALVSKSFDRLRQALKGELIRPGDPLFESARRGGSFNPTADFRPQLIVRCQDPEDVVRGLGFARETNLEIAVRSGGNDVLGACSVEGGVVLDLSSMDQVLIDPVRRRFSAGPGALSGACNQAAATHDLAPVLGCNPGVGLGGLLLGGGIGWFAGTEGAACDQLEAVDVVTADGRRLRASSEENAELFWGLRGGGGNFGIAAGFECRLRPVAALVGGVVGFRTDPAAFLRFYRDYMASAPDPLAVELNIYPAGPPGSGPPMVTAAAGWSGAPDRGLEVMAPLRRYAQPAFDGVGVRPFAEFMVPPGPPRPTAPFSVWRGGSLDVLSDAAIERFSQAIETAPRGWSLGLGHHMHGRILQAPKDGSPMARPAHRTTYFLSAAWGDARAGEASMNWVTASMTALGVVSSPRGYLNYLSRDDEPSVAATFGDAYPRLRRIKQRYDPDNVLHHNRNIRPA